MFAGEHTLLVGSKCFVSTHHIDCRRRELVRCDVKSLSFGSETPEHELSHRFLFWGPSSSAPCEALRQRVSGNKLAVQQLLRAPPDPRTADRLCEAWREKGPVTIYDTGRINGILRVDGGCDK